MLKAITKKFNFLRSMGLKYILYRARSAVVRPRVQVDRYLSRFSGHGLEIGGPSAIFKADGLFPVYPVAQCIDNVTFSNNTRWEGQVAAGKNFTFDTNKQPGTQFVLEGGGLSSLPDASYDFVLSSHMLEHTANPLRALHEWKRILRPHGLLLLILPHKDGSFDHRRPTTTLAHMQDDFEMDRAEDDTTHLKEIISLHDLHRDPQQASAKDFERWIAGNAVNRGAHHHVFDMKLSAEMLSVVGFRLADAEAALPYHIFLLATKPDAQQDVNNDFLLRDDAEPYRKSPFRSDRPNAGVRA